MSSSEVAAMIEGVLRHCTDMEIQRQYVDSHGQSEVAFAFSHLLGFDLLPRLKGIARQRLYLPAAADATEYPALAPIDDQELGVLALHLLQICLVYINTLFIQEVLDEPAWRNRMTAEDWRGLTPLIYHHVNPYGRIELDMGTRLPLAA